MAIKEHIVKVQTQIGVVELIETKRKNCPEGLRKPYEYIMDRHLFLKFYDALKALTDPIKSKAQCVYLDKKVLSKGFKLKLFVLGYKPDYCDGDHSGITKKEWEILCKSIQKLFYDNLGKDSKIYAERYTINDKFQIRMETYIATE